MLVAAHGQRAGSRIPFGELHAVVADDVDGKAVHLPVDAHARARTHHQQAILLSKPLQYAAAGVAQRRFVLGEGSVEIERNQTNFALHRLIRLPFQ